MKRATEREDNMIVIGAISIHALVKRATKLTKEKISKGTVFQSTPS